MVKHRELPAAQEMRVADTDQEGTVAALLCRGGSPKGDGFVGLELSLLARSA